ncbi:MAG: MG2 domain-containing protein, partial [Ilumatobacteraceae bacterium]
RVEIPAGTTAAGGAELAEAVEWSFATPPPQVRSFHGESDSLPLEPVFVAVFDQLVDPDAVLDSLTLTAGDDERAVRLATDDEIEADEQAARATSAALDDRWVAFRPVDALPTDAAVSVDIGPDTPSAEGPRRSTEVESYRGRTYGAFEVVRTDCGWGDDCEPSMPFVVELSNPIDPETLTDESVQVAPSVHGLRIHQYGATLEIVGATAGRTEYTVTLSGDVRDVFGQRLGDDAELTFEVGPARPTLSGPNQAFVTTDPSADRPQLGITTVNHERVRLRAWAVGHDDVDEYERYRDRNRSDTRPDDPPWPVVADTVIDIEGDSDVPVETSIDLTDALAESGGPVVVRIETTEDLTDGDDHWRNQPIVTWVQSTRVGVDAVIDHDRLLAWTTDLATGEPLPGVDVTLLGDGRTVTTDDDGLATVELGSAEVSGLVARSGDDEAFLPLAARPPRPGDGQRWYVFDDRGVYRPGETVRLTGWVRRLDMSAGSQLALPQDGADATAVDYTVIEPQGNEIASGTTELNALGGFNMSFDVPEAANLGPARVELQLAPGDGGERSQHSFQIQDFRTPEFEVTARNESAPPFFVAEPATVAVDAAYYAGGPLPDAEVNWAVTTDTTTYTPPEWDDFTFGIWQPWWWFEGPAHGGGGDRTIAEHVGRTDSSGTHHLQIDFDAPEVDLPSTVTAQATVFDVNRQAWASRTDLLVHPARLYVGIRSDRTFVEQGTPLRIDAAVTDVDGNVVADHEVEMTAGRLESTFVDGRWTEELTDTQTCTIDSTADPREDPARCEFATEVGGRYRITAVITDENGDRNRSELTMWVSGGQSRPTRTVEQEEVTVVPDQETYEPGDTAELLVQAPFAPASGLLTVERGGIVSSQPFDAPDGSAVLTVPIQEAHVPGLGVNVEMVGAAARVADDGTPLPDAPDRPAFASGRIDLEVPPVTRALDVTAAPADTEL